MGKHKHHHKERKDFPFQVAGWLIILSMAFIIGFRTLQVSSDENLLQIRKDPTVTNNMTILSYYLYGR